MALTVSLMMKILQVFVFNLSSLGLNSQYEA
jgi:hypothetical protein